MIDRTFLQTRIAALSAERESLRTTEQEGIDKKVAEIKALQEALATQVNAVNGRIAVYDGRLEELKSLLAHVGGIA